MTALFVVRSDSAGLGCSGCTQLRFGPSPAPTEQASAYSPPPPRTRVRPGKTDAGGDGGREAGSKEMGSARSVGPRSPPAWEFVLDRSPRMVRGRPIPGTPPDLAQRSEEHTSELQSR